jgi:hypothetical protein
MSAFSPEMQPPRPPQKPVVPRPSPEGAPEASASPILSVSRPRFAALHLLRGAPVRPPRRAGGMASAAGEAWPLAGALGRATTRLTVIVACSPRTLLIR